LLKFGAALLKSVQNNAFSDQTVKVHFEFFTIIFKMIMGFGGKYAVIPISIDHILEGTYNFHYGKNLRCGHKGRRFRDT